MTRMHVSRDTGARDSEMTSLKSAESAEHGSDGEIERNVCHWVEGHGRNLKCLALRLKNKCLVIKAI